MITLSNGQQVDESSLANGEQPDAGVIGLQKVIKGLEGGDFNNRSGDGSSSAGAYQWNNQPHGKSVPLKPGEMPSNWKNAAAQYLHDPNAPMTPANQNFVAYQQINSYKKSGLTPLEIDAKWNGAKIDPTTGKLVHVNQARADAFLKAVNGGTTEKNKFITTADLPPAPAQTQPSDNTAPGTFISNVGKGDIPAAVGSGIRDVGSALTFGGSEQLGNQLGTSFQAIPSATKDLFTGSNESQFHEQPSFGQTVTGTAKTVAGVGVLAGGGLLGDLLKGKSALQAPEVVNALENTLGKGETIANLSRQDAINALGNTLKEMPTSEVGGKAEQAILKALKELNPTLSEKQSLWVRLAKGGFNLVKGAALAKVFGDTVGGLIHQNTK